MPERLIDVPLESLPFIDEHSVAVAAPAEVVWDALVATLPSFTTARGGAKVADLLDCTPAERAGAPGRIGSTIPGFMVTRSIRPAVLALMGQHRFSCYALVFRISETPLGPVLLSAETRAEFPGRSGRYYRAAVIGTRGHVLATAGLLRAIRRRAERTVARPERQLRRKVRTASTRR